MDVLESYEKDTLRIGVKIADTSTKAISTGVLWLLGILKEKLFDKEVKGQVSIQKLTKEGYVLNSELVKNPNLQQLAKIMKKYNVGFSAMQQGKSNNYVLFFKAKEESQLHAALDAYLAKTVKRDNPDKSSQVYDTQRDEYDRQNVRGESQSEQQKMPDARNMAFDAQELTEEAKAPGKAVNPKPRSIPKALEKAKDEARVLEQLREAMRQMTRQRVPRKEPTR